MFDVTLGLAFLAGIVSFVSPCVLPLVPAYIGYMGGRLTNTVSAQVSVNASGQAVITQGGGRGGLSTRFSTFLHGLAFVGGFTLVFVLLGVITTAFIQVVGGQNVSLITGLIGRIGGVVIVFFGLHFMGVLPSIFNWIRRQESPVVNLLLVILLTVGGAALLLWGFAGTLAIWEDYVWRDFDGSLSPTIWAPITGILLAAVYGVMLFLGGAFYEPHRFLTRLTNTFDQMLYADTRRQMEASGSNGLWSSMLMGVVFAAGWTPCIGPVYGAILTMSADTGSVGQAMPLLTAYSLGLGIPFLIAAAALDSAQGFIRRLNRHMRTIKLVSGGFLVFIGLMVASGELQAFSAQLSGQFADVSIRVEECSLGWAEGDVYFSQLGDCLFGRVDYNDIIEANRAVGDAPAGETFAPLNSGQAVFTALAGLNKQAMLV